MIAKCECGHEFEVPDGTQAAKCPRCGREVEVAASDDWLSQLDMDSLSLEEGPSAMDEEQQPAPEAPPPQGVAFEESGAEPEPAALELGDLELELEIAGPQAAEAAGAAQAPPRGAAPRVTRREREVRAKAKAKAKEPPPPPKTLAALWAALKDDPNRAVSHLTEGIKDKQFLTQAGVALGALSLLGAAAYGWMTTMTSAAVGVAINRWIWLLLELAAACVMFNLLGYALKREARPFGICQGLALGRIGGLILAAPIALICLVILVTCRFMQPPPEAMFRAARWAAARVWIVYLMGAAGAQMAVASSLLKFGCGLGIVLGIVLTYATATFADTIVTNVAGLFS
ncbi:MAG: TFIIB-type zinc ribbon-containing protein [Planctomycetota bacterium]|jgi:hypothetical protein